VRSDEERDLGGFWGKFKGEKTAGPKKRVCSQPLGRVPLGGRGGGGGGAGMETSGSSVDEGPG